MVIMCCYSATIFAATLNTYNILLIGSDRRDTSWNGNSDSMILVTINSAAQKTYLTSFMRDMYADVPGYGGNKLNFAYAVGCASKLEETLISNYGVQIDNFIAVDFVDMANLVDYLDGVDIFVKDSEIAEVNKYSSWMQSKYGVPAGTPISGEGTWHLNGAQTVSYSRIRKVGNGDYERTERQRRVLSAIWESVRNLPASEMEGLIRQLISMIHTDLNAGDVLKLAAATAQSKDWEVVETRLPFDGMYYTQNEMLVPSDMGATRAKLRSLIYEGTESSEEQAVGTGTDVIGKVQQALNEAGYDCGAVDGLMGPNTEGAIRRYQMEHDLEGTGQIDDALLEALNIQ